MFYFRTLLNKAILISESQSSFTESIFSYSDFFFNYSQFVLNNFLICSVQKLSFQQETKRVSCTHLHYLIINSRVVSSRLLTSQIISFYVIVWALLFTRGIFTWVQTWLRYWKSSKSTRYVFRITWSSKEMNSNDCKTAQVGVSIPGKVHLFQTNKSDNGMLFKSFYLKWDF